MDDEKHAFQNDFDILDHDACMPANSGAHQETVIFSQDTEINTDRHFVDEVRREKRLLRDTSVVFTLFCQEKEGVIDTLFSKLQETGRGHKEDEDVNKLKEHVTKYLCRCIFENGKVHVHREAVLNITEEYTDGFYVDMLEDDISVMRTETEEFRNYCDDKDSKIKSHLQVVLKQEQEGGFTDECLKEREKAMKVLTRSLKAYFRICCSVKGKIIILERHSERAKLHSNEAECTDVVMQFEKELRLLKDLHSKRFEEYVNNEKEIAQKELHRQKSFIEEIDRLHKQLRQSCELEAKLWKQLKKTNDCLDEFARMFDDEQLKVKHLESKLKDMNDGLDDMAEKDLRKQEEIHQLEQDKSLLIKQFADLRSENHQLCKDIKILQNERQQFKRLNKEADTNLSYKMPNIAVLSDPNRPTKLAEMSSEIFDNEWTDAYEMLVDDKEKNKISFMLHLFKDVDTLCGNVAKQHDEAVTTSLTQMVIGFKERKRPYEPECSQTEDVCEEKSEVIRFKFDKLSPVQQDIDNITRTIQSDLAEQVTETICNLVLKENGPNQTDEIRNYVLKCSWFCWTARSHNPPVYVDFMEVTENMHFDMNVYKPYTKTGPLVDYIVWPPIYLHKGGPMLSKGVAQGKKKN